MTGHRLSGHVNEQHELVVRVPDSIPPGPVQVLIVPAIQPDEDEAAWDVGIRQAWAAELTDVREDIYTLEDGEPVDAPR